MIRHRLAAALGLSATLLVASPSHPARAATPHVVQPGESLWSIALSVNMTTRTVAAYNGLPEDAIVVTGQTVQVPSVEEGAAALAAAGITPGTATETLTVSSTDTGEAASGTATSMSAPGMGHIPSPWGELHLSPNAASAWNAMREASVATYGIDLHPAGTLSAFRGYSEQAALYEDYLAGIAPLAAAPGTSAHETGNAVDLATEDMRWVVDQIGGAYGWAKVESFDEWWHVNYVGG